ncbi:MAG: DNA polymerase III subunit gamma/tau [Synergistaceae bacterium]|nr:DNA polymerase III subunit gamma/tau [Synergistaceae bacterium]
MGISLYRRYRPQKFSEVAGQPAAVAVIVRSLRAGRVGHAYLFSGPRGCGKTSVARLLARALNCLEPVDGCEPCCRCQNCVAIAAGESLDVIEIDGASNNSVDEVRELKSHIMSVPMSSKYKVYIIDEVHMLSISAFNALLKTLEEPPEHVVFVLATTEAHKVPVTIRSRCQHIPFHRIDTQTIYERLTRVCADESMRFQPEALWEIARQADGAMRDGLSMLEQVAGSSGETVTASDVEAALGQGSRSSLERWLGSWRTGDMKTFCELDRMLAAGASPQRFLEEMFALVRNLWLVARWSDILETLDASAQEKEYLKREAPLWDPLELGAIMRFLAELLPQTRMGLRMDVLSGLLMAKITESVHRGSGDRAPLEPAAPRGLPAHLEARKETEGPERRPPVPVASLPVGETTPPETSPPKTPFLETTPAAPAPDLNPKVPDERSVNGEPCGEERWEEVMKAFHDADFLAYCGLLDARALVDGDRLVVDIPLRYSFEVLRLERNRSTLRKILTRFWPDVEVVLHHAGLSASCDGTPPPGVERAPGFSKAPEKPKTEQAEQTEKSEKSAAAQPAGGIPFSGLVRDVTRWMRGEVILVRRGVDEDADADDATIEE